MSGQCFDGEYWSIAQHPVQITVWGDVAVVSKSWLFCFQETCNKQRYIQMRKTNSVFEEINDLFGEFQSVFQYDNAPYVARGTTEFVRSRALENVPAHGANLH